MQDVVQLLLSLVMVAATVMGVTSDITSPLWRTGNTQVVHHPLDSNSMLPDHSKLLAHQLDEDAVWNFRSLRGPFLPTFMWKNASHCRSLDDLIALGLVRYFLRHRNVADAGAVQLIHADSWTLCYADDARPDGERIERGQVCDAFRTRSGVVPLGTATIHRVEVAVASSGRVEGAEHTITVTIMEESQQIFPLNEIQHRRQFVRELALHEISRLRVDVSENIHIPKLDKQTEIHGLRGISLLSVEKRTARRSFFTRKRPTGLERDDDTAHCTFIHVGVGTQNVWNFNGDWSLRRRLIAEDVILQRSDKDAQYIPVDILTTQEVRYHSNAPDSARSCAKAQNADDDEMPDVKATSTSVSGKSQSADLADCLDSIAKISRHEIDHAVPTVESFVFQPAMTYLHLSRFAAPRIEMEGLMNVILRRVANTTENGVRIIPIASAHRLLTRDVKDNDDGHQRAILCSVVCVVSTSMSGCLRLDVCTSHFSLGERSQNLNAKESTEFMDGLAKTRTFALSDSSCTSERDPRSSCEEQRLPAAAYTIFTGDLNSEPHHRVYEIFRDSGYEDAWLNCTDNNQNIGDDGEVSNRHSSEIDGLTFNTNEDELVKRIDFVLIKQQASDAPSMEVDRCSRIGRQKKAGDVSSDHLGVVIRFTFNVCE